MNTSTPIINERRKSESKWTLDKHINVTILMAFLGQFAVSLWWVATFSTKTDIRIEALEKQTVSLNQLPQRISAMEAQLVATNQLLRDIRDDQRSKQQ